MTFNSGALLRVFLGQGDLARDPGRQTGERLVQGIAVLKRRLDGSLDDLIGHSRFDTRLPDSRQRLLGSSIDGGEEEQRDACEKTGGEALPPQSECRRAYQYAKS